MTSRITTTRTMTGPQLTVGDFRRLFEGASDNTVPDICVDKGDRFGASSTTVTVAVAEESRRTTPAYASDYVSGTGRNTTQDNSDPYGPREASR